ncbi:doublecortin domain-containing protein 2B isoform X2 [Dromiciops gliroides]|uniref:doublecortin domain-containing protein 2B isoform X2 n=1 Tax=Dromiciops gliroides TaxID=33562 RepID=UPI001CC5674B|nr:doublecortin domain-containing protein 2B isoform X2 [Dromiciops gliroides]
MASTAPGPPVARKVVVYRNGDPFSPGRRLVVTHRRFPTFEAFLNEVTAAVQAPLAIRTLYTPQHGHVITDLSELQSGGEYVAAGFERFRRLPYIYPGGEKPGRKNIRFPAPPSLQRPNYRPPGRRIPALASCTIQLCTLEGVPVLGRETLVNGGYYVAVSEDDYKALPYLELLVPSPSLPGGFWRPPRLEPRAYRQKADSFWAPGAQPSKKESSVYFAKPMLARPHLRRRPLRQPGERGVYGAAHTRRELAGAQEVEEDSTTLTEVPVDQVGGLCPRKKQLWIQLKTVPQPSQVKQSTQKWASKALGSNPGSAPTLKWVCIAISLVVPCSDTDHNTPPPPAPSRLVASSVISPLGLHPVRGQYRVPGEHSGGLLGPVTLSKHRCCTASPSLLLYSEFVEPDGL